MFQSLDFQTQLAAQVVGGLVVVAVAALFPPVRSLGWRILSGTWRVLKRTLAVPPPLAPLSTAPQEPPPWIKDEIVVPDLLLMPVLWASLSDLQRRVLLLLGKADGYPLMEQIIGQRFSLTRYETKEAIERLEELNLVGKLTNGDLVAFDLTRDGRKLYLDVTKVPQPSLPIETRVAASPVSSAAVERTADEEWDQLTENQRRVLTCLAKADGQAVDEREIAGKCELSNLRTAQELGGLEQLGVVKRHRHFAYGNYVSAELTPVGVRLVLAKGIEAVNSRANRRGPHR